MAGTDDTALYTLGSNQFDGTNFRAWVQKADMTFGTRQPKSVTKIRPHIDGTGPVDIYVGCEMIPHQGTTWKGPYTFTSGVHSDILVRATGAYIGIRVESTGDKEWKLENLEIYWKPQGPRGNGV